MASIREDIAELRKVVREDIEKLDGKLDALGEKVLSLELTRAKEAGARGGVKSTFSAASSVIALLISILSFFFSGCAEIPVPTCTPPAKWPAPPLVAIEPDMPDAVRENVLLGLAFWAGHGKPLEVVARPADWGGFHEIPQRGFIVITYAAEAYRPGVSGATWKMHYGDINGPISFAFIEITDIEPDTVSAHEIGHALGLGSCLEPLGHSQDIKNLMFPLATGESGVTKEQLEWVR